MISGLDGIAEDVLDNLIALIHRLLDQRITRERADDVHARHRGFVLRGQHRQRGRVLAGKANAPGFHQTALRHGAQARNDAIAGHHRFAGWRAQHNGARLAVIPTHINARHAGVEEAVHLLRGDGLRDAVEVAFLRPGEFVLAIDDVHGVVFRQGQHVFDCRIACADHDDGFTVIFIGIVQLILNKEGIFTRTTEAARIPLHTDAQDDVLCVDDIAAAERQFEVTLDAFDLVDATAILDVGLCGSEATLPLPENHFPRTGFKSNRAA